LAIFARLVRYHKDEDGMCISGRARRRNGGVRHMLLFLHQAVKSVRAELVIDVLQQSLGIAQFPSGIDDAQ
jgi:hypothetical protein